jgi:hypothetical protein
VQTQRTRLEGGSTNRLSEAIRDRLPKTLAEAMRQAHNLQSLRLSLPAITYSISELFLHR